MTLVILRHAFLCGVVEGDATSYTRGESARSADSLRPTRSLGTLPISLLTRPGSIPTSFPHSAALASGLQPGSKVQAQRYLENGNKFFDKGKFKEASIMYRRALQKDLRSGEAYYRLGLADLKLSAYGDASRMLRRAVELQPNNADATTKLADLLLLASTQQSSQAPQMRKDVLELAVRLIERDPQSFDGHRLSGQVALLNGDLPTALTELAKANAAKPNQPALALSYFEALVSDKQFPAAEKVARDLIAKEKTVLDVYDMLYLQYARQGKMSDAEQVLKLKVANNPQRANYLLELAAHYYAANRRPEMDAVIQRMTDEKAFPEGHLLAGDFYLFRLREFDHARQQYEAAIAAFPKDKALYQKTPDRVVRRDRQERRRE